MTRPYDRSPAAAGTLPEATARLGETEHLTALARRVAVSEPPDDGDLADTVAVLAQRPDGLVVRYGSVVAKAHAPDMAPAEWTGLRTRLHIAAHPRCAQVLLPPRTAEVAHLPGGRPATVWPYGAPVSPDHPEAAPWEEAGVLLARLHTVLPGTLTGLPGPIPTMRGPLKAARAVARLRATTAAASTAGQAVLGAWTTLPAWTRAEAPAPRADSLCHGDLHLGQLVRLAGPSGPWLLIDVDDLGLGDPTWDLARFAAWYATGLLAPQDWQCFLAAYQATGGTAVPPAGDPWVALDTAARALTVQTAATALSKATAAGRELDEAERAMVEACGRIARWRRP